MDEQRAPPRAEELIVEIWRQRSVLTQTGRRPARVVLSPENHRIIQAYRARLGTLDNEQLDYLGTHDLFGLEIFVDPEVAVSVEAE